MVIDTTQDSGDEHLPLSLGSDRVTGMAVIQAHVTLRALRTSRGLTSVALARQLKERGVTVDPDHILAVELGHRSAGYELRVAWAEELGIKPGEIRFESDLRELIALADKDREAKEAA